MTSVRAGLVPVFAPRSDPSEAVTEERPPSSPRHRQRVLVAIPAYNEERYIASVVHGVRLEGFECAVIDDGSSDRTVEIAEAAGAIVDLHGHNQGKAAAVTRSLRAARKLRVDLLVVMDGDWQHDPREIHTLLEPLQTGHAEIVSGSRFLPNGLGRIPSVRGIGLRAMTALSNAASGHRVTDSQTGFHAFSRQAIDKLRFRSNGFSVEMEMQFLARALGLRHVEVPISARYHDEPKRNVIGQGAHVLDGLIRLVAHYRPLLFFGVPSGILLLAGIVLGLHVVNIYSADGVLAGGYALLSVMVVIIGVLGLFTGLLLHVLRGIVLGLEGQLQSVVHALELEGSGTSRSTAADWDLAGGVRPDQNPG
jgi:glycosyltransferase involved in cell wall biosynthesis